MTSRFGACKLVGNVKLVGGMMGMDCGVFNSCGFVFVLLEFRRISSGRGYALQLKDSQDESHTVLPL